MVLRRMAFFYIHFLIRESFYKVTKRHHSVNFQNMEIPKYTFLRKLN